MSWKNQPPQGRDNLNGARRARYLQIACAVHLVKMTAEIVGMVAAMNECELDVESEKSANPSWVDRDCHCGRRSWWTGGHACRRCRLFCRGAIVGVKSGDRFEQAVGVEADRARAFGVGVGDVTI